MEYFKENKKLKGKTGNLPQKNSNNKSTINLKGLNITIPRCHT